MGKTPVTGVTVDWVKLPGGGGGGWKEGGGLSKVLCGRLLPKVQTPTHFNTFFH